MRLAECGIDIPKYWEHDPLLTDEDGNTVAMCYAINGNIPNDRWNHDKYLRNNSKETVKTLLKYNDINIPEYWNYDDTLDEYYNIYDIKYNRLITSEFNDNKDKVTYAIYLSSKGIIP